MNLRDRVQAIQTELSAIADAVSGVQEPAPGPGITPMPTETRWWRNPGAPLVDPVPPAYDDVPTCKRYAAQGYGPGGTRTLAPQDLEPMLVLCDKVGADNATQADIEALVEHGGACDVDTVQFALLAGWSQSGGTRPSLFIGGQKIADLVKQPGTAGKPSGIGA